MTSGASECGWVLGGKKTYVNQIALHCIIATIYALHCIMATIYVGNVWLSMFYFTVDGLSSTLTLPETKW